MHHRENALRHCILHTENDVIYMIYLTYGWEMANRKIMHYEFNCCENETNEERRKSEAKKPFPFVDESTYPPASKKNLLHLWAQCISKQNSTAKQNASAEPLFRFLNSCKIWNNYPSNFRYTYKQHIIPYCNIYIIIYNIPMSWFSPFWKSKTEEKRECWMQFL